MLDPENPLARPDTGAEEDPPPGSRSRNPSGQEHSGHEQRKVPHVALDKGGALDSSSNARPTCHQAGTRNG